MPRRHRHATPDGLVQLLAEDDLDLVTADNSIRAG
jgi:hypothetical protein